MSINLTGHQTAAAERAPNITREIAELSDTKAMAFVTSPTIPEAVFLDGETPEHMFRITDSQGNTSIVYAEEFSAHYEEFRRNGSGETLYVSKAVSDDARTEAFLELCAQSTGGLTPAQNRANKNIWSFSNDVERLKIEAIAQRGLTGQARTDCSLTGTGLDLKIAA